MEMNSFVEIVIFSDSEEWDAPLCAKSDKTLSISLISRATVARLQLEYTESQRETVEDSEHKLYSPIGQLQLRWYKKGRARSHPETFYVVEMTACEVILGATASSETTDANDSAIRILGLDQQTTAEKERQEQKKLEVQQRRAQEKKQQEERETKKRQDEREARKLLEEREAKKRAQGVKGS